MPGADNGSGAVQLPSPSANKFIFTKRLALNAVTVIPATFNHAVGEPGNDHSGATAFTPDFITDQQDHFCLRYQEETDLT